VTAPARLVLPDALRALALGGVLLVNTMGYASMPWGPLLGAIDPAGDWAARVLQASVGAVVQGKAYPALAFLFGMSLAWSVQDRQAQSRQRARRRLGWLLVLGVLHGLFLYGGDILKADALCGLLVLPAFQVPWSRLRKRLRRALWWAGTGFAIMLALTMLPKLLADASADVAPDDSLAAAPHLGAFVALNASAYLSANTWGLVYMLPLLQLFMLAGIAAARLRWLTHPRWQGWREALVRRWWRRLLACNVLYGLALVGLAFAGSGWRLVLEIAGPIVCVPLSAIVLAHLANCWAHGQRAWAAVIAPLGRCTLSVYLANSVLCMVLLSGVGLGWEPGTVATAALAGMVWTGALLLARRSTQRWPLEAFLGRQA
jgi:uncharacterized protein